MTDLTLLNYDGNPDAVINPFRDEGFVFPDRMLFAFITEENVARFVAQYPHTVSGTFETVSNVFTVYTLNVEGTDIGICRAPLGAAAAVQLLEFLIAYGAKHIIAVGSCGVLTDTAENEFLVVAKALRDEGTSFHYLPAAADIVLNAEFAAQIKQSLTAAHIPVRAVQTWTNDAFFRETPAKIAAALAAGYTVVEMECAAMAACAQFRGAVFGQLLFTGDSLANVAAHDARNFGQESHMAAMTLAVRALRANAE
ncbi:nucleoside phosphorylase [Lacticaseibacillus sharpeae]|uniref:Uridine phosphorylase n=1 Tax=Lacticaseibacillus sharpeae JCM 1186 = DSM 20505 TaxID=1291052 RepID=A0A0R1ZJ89_9LACO|nr:nucleoside phosphorylase [Lacticaseibacillus sharpeae]KRM55015.1 phosphorylase pnp udp family protein [Lacticaseibacillus sharpeae JCM 1186 = DSM 20505]